MLLGACKHRGLVSTLVVHSGVDRRQHTRCRGDVWGHAAQKSKKERDLLYMQPDVARKTHTHTHTHTRTHTARHTPSLQASTQMRGRRDLRRHQQRLQLREACQYLCCQYLYRQYLHFCPRKCASICTFVRVNEGGVERL
jgi:pyruvate-formate lyase